MKKKSRFYFVWLAATKGVRDYFRFIVRIDNHLQFAFVILGYGFLTGVKLHKNCLEQP